MFLVQFNLCQGIKKIHQASLYFDAFKPFSDSFTFSKNTTVLHRKQIIHRNILDMNHALGFMIIAMQRSEEVEICATRRSRVFKINDNCLLYVWRENLLFKKRSHHPLKIAFPFHPMRFGIALMLIPGEQMSELMNRRN